MADKKISDLPASQALAGADLIEVTQGGASKKATGAQVLALARMLSHPGYVVGNSYLPPRSTPVANGATTANALRLRPLLVAQPITASSLFVNVVTAAAGGNVQVGVYNSSPTTRLPTTLVASTPSASTGATGILTLTPAAPITLQPGLYWYAINTDSATVTFSVPSGTALMELVGTNPPNLTASALTYAQAFGTWPDLTGATLGPANSTAGAVVGFTVSALP